MKPPLLLQLPEQTLSGSAESALEDPIVLQVWAAFHAAYEKMAGIDSDDAAENVEVADDSAAPDDAAVSAPQPTKRQKGPKRAQKKKKQQQQELDQAEPQMPGFKQAVKDAVPPASVPDITAHHLHLLAAHSDLRQWPCAQFVVHEEQSNHFHVGASNMYSASFHGYGTMELDLIYLVLDDSYDIQTMPLRLDLSKEAYDSGSNTHGRDAIHSMAFVSPNAHPAPCGPMHHSVADLLFCVVFFPFRTWSTSRSHSRVSSGCRCWRGSCSSRATVSRRWGAC